MNIKLKKGLIGLGITAAIASGIIGYLGGLKQYLTWDEYQEIIKVYNQELEYIKADCENDPRCVIINHQTRVKFDNVKNEKDIIKKLNQWVKEDAGKVRLSK